MLYRNRIMLITLEVFLWFSFCRFYSFFFHALDEIKVYFSTSYNMDHHDVLFRFYSIVPC